MVRKTRALTCSLGALLAMSVLSGCANQSGKASNEISASTAESVTIKNCGVENTFKSAPKKTVSMGVTGLAYLFAAGAEKSIIGRVNEWGEEPPAWIGKKADGIKVLSDESMSIEALLKLQPDLVYGGGFDSKSSTPQAVAQKGIPAVVDAPECNYFFPEQAENESFDAILKEVSQLGSVMRTVKSAEKTVGELREQLKGIEGKKVGKQQKVAYAYYYGDDKELFSYGNKGVMGEINRTLNLTSAIDPDYHPHQGPIAPEAFVKSDPDVIIVLTGMGGATKESTLQRMKEIPGYSEMKAVKNGRIIYAESAAAYASPTAIYSTIELAKQLEKLGA